MGNAGEREVENFNEWLIDKFPTPKSLNVHEVCRIVDLYKVPYNQRVAEYCEQYEYCKEWGTTPYPSYTDTPKEWKEIAKEIDKCKN